ncbi:MAG: ABC transporter substrate binding protein [Planctomycetota bacterium]
MTSSASRGAARCGRVPAAARSVRLLLMPIVLTCLAADEGLHKKVVLVLPEDPVSMPYRQATDAMERDLERRAHETVIVRLPRKPEPAASDLGRRVGELKPDAVVAVGSSALTALQSLELGCPLVYTMVLNPAHLVKQSQVIGVSLDVPPSVIVQNYHSLFPDRRRVAVVFSPEHSAELLQALNEACSHTGLDLLARGVDSREGALRAQRQVAGAADGFIVVADPLAASQEVVDALLQLCLPLNKPVVGLKSSEVEKGAAFAFLLDYDAVGRQTAALVARLLAGERPGAEPPQGLSLVVNRNVLDRLAVREPYPVSVPVKQVFPAR